MEVHSNTNNVVATYIDRNLTAAKDNINHLNPIRGKYYYDVWIEIFVSINPLETLFWPFFMMETMKSIWDSFIDVKTVSQLLCLLYRTKMVFFCNSRRFHNDHYHHLHNHHHSTQATCHHPVDHPVDKIMYVLINRKCLQFDREIDDNDDINNDNNFAIASIKNSNQLTS